MKKAILISVFSFVALFSVAFIAEMKYEDMCNHIYDAVVTNQPESEVVKIMAEYGYEPKDMRQITIGNKIVALFK